METMSPQRPYLLRAMHEWMTDNGQTPYLVVDATLHGVSVPDQFVEDGKIILNVSYAAVRSLDMGNEAISFEARFAGQPHRVHVPLGAVLGVYARETGRGMVFSAEEGLESAGDADSGEAAADSDGQDEPRRPRLKVIK